MIKKITNILIRSNSNVKANNTNKTIHYPYTFHINKANWDLLILFILLRYLLLNADGSFTGQYSDSDMGDAGEGYPNGTLYLCTFSGRFEIQPTDENGVTPLRLAELTREDEVGRIEFRDGIRCIYSEPIGLYVYEEDRLAEMLRFYTPDTPVAELSEEMLYFWPFCFSEAPPDTLESFALWSPESGSAFFTYPEDYDS